MRCKYCCAFCFQHFAFNRGYAIVRLFRKAVGSGANLDVAKQFEKWSIDSLAQPGVKA